MCVRVCVCVCVGEVTASEGPGVCVCVGAVAASEGSDLPGAPSDSHRHWERAGLGNRSPRFLKAGPQAPCSQASSPTTALSKQKALEAGELSLPSPQDLRLCLSV